MGVVLMCVFVNVQIKNDLMARWPDDLMTKNMGNYGCFIFFLILGS